MHKRIIFCFIIFGLLACEKSIKPPKPKNLIPKDKMVLVLEELFVVNSAKGVNRKLLENNGVVPEQYILNKFNIDSTQFAQSNDYYAHDIEAYQSIIEGVKANLTKKSDSLKVVEEEEKSNVKDLRDSLNRNRLPNPVLNKDLKLKKSDSLEEIED